MSLTYLIGNRILNVLSKRITLTKTGCSVLDQIECFQLTEREQQLLDLFVHEYICVLCECREFDEHRIMIKRDRRRVIDTKGKEK